MGVVQSCFDRVLSRNRDLEEDDGVAKRVPEVAMPKRASYTPSPVAARSSIAKARSTRNGGGGGDVLTDEEALAAAAMLLQVAGKAPDFDRSASLRYPGGGKKQQQLQQQLLPRSSSSRPRSISEPLVPPRELIKHESDLRIDELETKHFVLVHGGGFGAWCWYKTIALLGDSGFRVNAIDLTGSGIDSFDPNNIKSLSQYVNPLTSFLERLKDEEKVILVGHDLGGTCILYAMEEFPSKIAKAVFLSAAMLTSGQSTLNFFNQQEDENDLMRQSQKFLYANGKDCPPTAIDLDKSLLYDLLFNQSPSKDVALASVSMRPIPFAPILEKLSLTEENYGSVRRFYIGTTEDNAIPFSVQESMCSSNPPERVFRLKGSDHSPFFSKPQALHKILVEIAVIPPPYTEGEPEPVPEQNEDLER